MSERKLYKELYFRSTERFFPDNEWDSKDKFSERFLWRRSKTNSISDYFERKYLEGTIPKKISLRLSLLPTIQLEGRKKGFIKSKTFSRRDITLATIVKRKLDISLNILTELNFLKYFKRIESLSLLDLDEITNKKLSSSAYGNILTLKSLKIYSNFYTLSYSNITKTAEWMVLDLKQVDSVNEWTINKRLFLPRMENFSLDSQKIVNEIISDTCPVFSDHIKLFHCQYRFRKLDFNDIVVNEDTILKLFIKYHPEIKATCRPQSYSKIFEILREPVNFNFMISISEFGEVNITSYFKITEIDQRLKNLNDDLFIAREIVAENIVILHAKFAAQLFSHLFNMYFNNYNGWILYFGPTKTLTNSELIETSGQIENILGLDRIFHNYKMHYNYYDISFILINLEDLRINFVSNPREVYLENIRLNVHDDMPLLLRFLRGCRKAKKITLELKMLNDEYTEEHLFELFDFLKDIKEFKLKLIDILTISNLKNEKSCNELTLELSSNSPWIAHAINLAWNLIQPNEVNYKLPEFNEWAFIDLCQRIKDEKCIKVLSLTMRKCHSLEKNQLRPLTEVLIENWKSLKLFNLNLYEGNSLNINKLIMDFDEKYSKLSDKDKFRIKIELIKFWAIDTEVKELSYVN